MENDAFLDIKTIAKRMDVSETTVRNYENALKESSPGIFKQAVVWDKTYTKGRGRKLYHVRLFEQEAQRLDKENKARKKAGKAKGRASKIKKAKHSTARQESIYDAEAVPEEIPIRLERKHGNHGRYKIDEYEAVMIVRSIAELFMAGSHSVDGACRYMGITPARFWKIVASSDEATDLWEKAVAQRITQSAVETEFWVMKRLMDRLKTTKIKKEKIDYEYRVRLSDRGEAERVPVEVSKVEIYEDFIPSASDIISMRKMALEIHLDAKKRTGGPAGESQYVSEKSESQLRKEIEEYDRMIKELEEKAAKEAEDRDK